MNTSIFLARVLGWYIVILIPAVFIHKKDLGKIVKEFSKNRVLLLVTALFNLTVGLFIVELHSVWVFGWPVIITLLGWMAIIKGIVRLYIPDALPRIAAKFNEKTLSIWCGAFFLIGIYLLYHGYN